MRKHRFFTYTILAFATLVTGCHSRLTGNADRVARQKAILSALDSSAILKAPALILKYHEANSSEAEKVRVRNQLVDISMIEIDQRHSLFIDELTTSKKTFDTITEFGAVVTAATSAAFNPASTKSVLSLVSGAFTAGNTSVSKNMFYEQTMKALVQQMSAQRRAVASDLIQGIGKNTDIYPLSAAMHDLERYYFAGTVEGAFASIQDGAAKKEAQAEEKIESVRRNLEAVMSYRELAGRWIREEGTTAARTKLKAWLQDQPEFTQMEARVALANAAINSTLSPSEIAAALPEDRRAGADQLITADRKSSPRTATFTGQHLFDLNLDLLIDMLPDDALSNAYAALSKYDILETRKTSATK